MALHHDSALKLAHVLSIAALVSYTWASLGYARALGFSAGTVGASPPSAKRAWSNAGMLRSVLIFGLICHLLFIVITDVAAVPLARFPYVVSLMSLGLVGAFLLLERRVQLSALGAFVAPSALAFLLMSVVLFHLRVSTAGSTEGSPLVMLHLMATVVSYVMFFIAGAVSALLLLSESALKRKKLLVRPGALPSLIFLDRFHRGLIVIGFLLLLFGVGAGTISSAALGMDRALLMERLLWVAPAIGTYIFLLVAMFYLGQRGRRVAWITLGCLCVLLITLFGSVGGGGGFHVR